MFDFSSFFCHNLNFSFDCFVENNLKKYNFVVVENTIFCKEIVSGLTIIICVIRFSKR